MGYVKNSVTLWKHKTTQQWLWPWQNPQLLFFCDFLRSLLRLRQSERGERDANQSSCIVDSESRVAYTPKEAWVLYTLLWAVCWEMYCSSHAVFNTRCLCSEISRQSAGPELHHMHKVSFLSFLNTHTHTLSFLYFIIGISLVSQIHKHLTRRDGVCPWRSRHGFFFFFLLAESREHAALRIFSFPSIRPWRHLFSLPLALSFPWAQE